MLVNTLDDSVTDITFVMPPSHEEKHRAYYEKRNHDEIKCDECGLILPRSEMRYNQTGWVCFEHHDVCNVCGKKHPLDKLTAVHTQLSLVKVCKPCSGLINMSSNSSKSVRK